MRGTGIPALFSDRPFRPTDFGQPALWLDAALGISGASPVTAWADQSGHGRNVSGGTAVKNNSDAGYNGEPTLSFTNGGGSLMTSAAVNLPQPLTYFVVCEATIPTCGILATGSGTNANDVLLGRNGGAPALVSMYAGTTVLNGAGVRGVGAKCVIGAVFNGAASFCSVNASNAQEIAPGTSPGGNTLQSFGVGGGGITFGANLTGKIAYLLVYPFAATVMQIHRVFQYCGARFNIVVS